MRVSLIALAVSGAGLVLSFGLCGMAGSPPNANVTAAGIGLFVISLVGIVISFIAVAIAALVGATRK